MCVCVCDSGWCSARITIVLRLCLLYIYIILAVVAAAQQLFQPSARSGKIRRKNCLWYENLVRGARAKYAPVLLVYCDWVRDGWMEQREMLFLFILLDSIFHAYGYNTSVYTVRPPSSTSCLYQKLNMLAFSTVIYRNLFSISNEFSATLHAYRSLPIYTIYV